MATAIAESLLHFIWQGAALGVLAFLVFRRVGDQPAARYAIGLGTLIAMALAPVVTSVWLMSDTMAPIGGVRGSVAMSRGFTLPVEWVLGIWACGVAVCGVRLAGGWVVARQMTTRAVQPVADEIQIMATRVASRLAVTTPFRVLESTIAASPMMIGWIKPVVLLPTATLAGLSPSQLEALLAHEFAHMRRHDYLVNLLQSAIETLLFYHPAVWWVSGSVRESREQCCDDLTVSVCDRLTYVSALSSVAALRSASPALAAGGGLLRSRVERLLRPQPSASFSMGWLGVIPVALVLAAAMPMASTSQGGLPTQSRPSVPPPAIAHTQTVSDHAPDPVLPRPESTTTTRSGPVSPETSAPRESPAPIVRPALPVVLDFLMPTTQAMPLQTPPPALPPPPLPAPQVIPVRRVAVGDTIRLDFYNLSDSDADMRKHYVVGPDGAIEVKYAGRLMVAGKTLPDVARSVLQGLEPMFYPEGVIQVTAVPAEVAKEAEAPKPVEVLAKVQVQGQVLSPGEKNLRGTQLTVVRAIAAANGFTPNAGEEIEIRRMGGRGVVEIIHVTRTELTSGYDPPLLNDDIVTVKTGRIFFVAGEVNGPGTKIWSPGMTVGKAVSLSNGMTTRGKLGYISRPIKDATGKVLRYEGIKLLKPETEVLPDDTLHIARKWFGN